METCKECRNFKPTQFDDEYGHCRKRKVMGAIMCWSKACDGFEGYNV